MLLEDSRLVLSRIWSYPCQTLMHCLALYALLADKNFFKKKILRSASKFDSILGGHPEFGKVPGVEASTGALGHGPAIGVGMALSAKLNKSKYKTFVIVGDGEINEGSFWESSMIASKHKLNNFHRFSWTKR